jgi:hypothetical protein
MCFRPLSCDPFTDIGRAIPEFRSVSLPESKEFHGFPVDKKNVFEVDSEGARFLFQDAPKHVDMFACNPAANEQHYEVVIANSSINSATHFGFRFTFFIPLVLERWVVLNLSDTSTWRLIQVEQGSCHFQVNENKKGGDKSEVLLP